MKIAPFLATAIFTYQIGAAPNLYAQTDLQKAQNLATCLSGRYPILCKHQWLTANEQKRVKIAENRQNLSTCLTGRYPSLCRKDRLTAEELNQVTAAEKRENLRTCVTGRYKSLCKKSLLSSEELERVLAAEQTENLRICLTGRFPSLCDRNLLSPAQQARAHAAEKNAIKSKNEHTPTKASSRRSLSSSNCESGHWIDSVSDDGQIIKLEDGSVWEVDPVDAIYSMLWLPTTEIVICDGKLINTDDNESVSAQQIR